MDQVFTLSSTKHIPLRHRFVRLHLDLLAVWHRVLHRLIFNNEKAHNSKMLTTLQAQDGFGSFSTEPAGHAQYPMSASPR
jgi:hypothetical protein